MGAENRLERERIPETVSVSVFLRPRAYSTGLVLVETDGLVGLPAGGLIKNEYLIDGVRRELRQETGIKEGNITFDTHVDFSLGFGIAPRYVISVPGDERTQVGLAFDATYYGPILSSEGWEVAGDKVTSAKRYRMRQLMRLVEGHVKSMSSVDGKGGIYKSHFNLPLLMAWIVSETWIASKRRDGGYYSYAENWLNKMSGKIEGLEKVREGISGPMSWRYVVSCLVGTQNYEALRRSRGYAWG